MTFAQGGAEEHQPSAAENLSIVGPVYVVPSCPQIFHIHGFKRCAVVQYLLLEKMHVYGGRRGWDELK